jgi:hypothetical protein
LEGQINFHNFRIQAVKKMFEMRKKEKSRKDEEMGT